MIDLNNLPPLLTMRDIVGDRKRGIPPLLPICRSTFEDGVGRGRFPQPVWLTPRRPGWKREDILAIIEGKQPLRSKRGRVYRQNTGAEA
jgi:predicted DNA-binding transcriptional regulator AlpA